jgi:methyltransferase (TIGR00027 family)
MKEPDSSAQRTALWRALHLQVDDQPFILEDEIGLKLIAPAEGWQERPDMKFIKRIRASILARARFIEDLVVEQCQQGVCQYVLLGAGLDSFAQRRTDMGSKVQVFEIDRADTLHWKAQRLTELGFGIPDYLHFVTVNFETSSWMDELIRSGFDQNKPAVVACTGVTLYLTREAIASTLHQLAAFALGSTLAITFNLPVELVDEEDQPLIEMSVKGARASGTPMISFFAPGETLALAREAGIKDASIVSTKDMEQLYFANRTDNLFPASGEYFMLAKI